MQQRPKLDIAESYLQSYRGDICRKIVSASRSQRTRKVLPLTSVSGVQRSVLYQNWLRELKLNWTQINHVNSQSALEEVVNKYKQVFDPDVLGKLKDVKATFIEDGDVMPKFHKARPVPYALKNSVR